MNDVKRFILPISIAVPALFAGIAIGHYASPAPQITPAQATASTSAEQDRASSNASKPAATPDDMAQSDASDADENQSNSNNIIARMKAALGRPNSRHTYATFSKLADSIDPKNVREVLAFADGLQNPQEKSMLLSLVIGRWAEFDPKAAIAYAQNIPPGTSRNWAITSAVSGWAERDANAASAWAQQLPPGAARDQAMQTIVSALAEKDPNAALAFLQTLPAGRSRQNLYWPIFTKWTATDPAAAAERALQLPAGSSRDSGSGIGLHLGELLADWAGTQSRTAEYLVDLGEQRSATRGGGRE
jgi:hypothetical protein